MASRTRRRTRAASTEPPVRGQRSRPGAPARDDHGFWRNNALSLVLGAMFLLSFVGHGVAGHYAENGDRIAHGEPPLTLIEFLGTGEFISTVFENWESEFLQMGVFVLLTVWLRQRGSAESRPFSEQEEKDVEDAQRKYWVDAAPPAARWKGIAGWAYRNSLSLALFGLFALSFVLHLLGSWRAEIEQSRQHAEPPPGLLDHLVQARFWFESFQNWQSEFLSVMVLVVLSIFLRQQHSAQSKEIDAPHSATGS